MSDILHAWTPEGRDLPTWIIRTYVRTAHSRIYTQFNHISTCYNIVLYVRLKILYPNWKAWDCMHVSLEFPDGHIRQLGQQVK